MKMNTEAYIIRSILLAVLQITCTALTESNENYLSRHDEKYLSFHGDTSDKESKRVKRDLVQVPEPTTVQVLSLTSETLSTPEIKARLIHHSNNTVGAEISTKSSTEENTDLVRSESTPEDNLALEISTSTEENKQTAVSGFEETRITVGMEREITLRQAMSARKRNGSEETIEQQGTQMTGRQTTEETTVDMETTIVLQNGTEETVNGTLTTMVNEDVTVTQSSKFNQGLYTQRVVDDIWYVCHGIFGTIFEIIGILGNILCIFVLAHQDLRSSTSILLRSLAVYDVMVLTSYLFMVSLNQVFKHTDIFAGFKEYIHTPMFPILFGLASLSFMGSYYTTVAISIERCLVVSVPLKATAWFSVARAKLISGFIFLLVFVYSIPRFMVFKYTSSWDNEKQRYVIAFAQTEFSKSHFYVSIYSVIMNISCKVFIPLTILGISTCVMIRAVVKNSRIRKHLRSNATSNHNRFTAMVMAVMTISLLSLLTGAAEVILHRIYKEEACAMVCGALSAVSELVAIINSSINFLLYCFFGSKFREVVRKLLPWTKTNTGGVGSRRTMSTQ